MLQEHTLPVAHSHSQVTFNDPSRDHHQLPKKPQKYHWYASRYLCLITLLVLLCFSFRHLVRSLRTRLRRNRQRTELEEQSRRRPPFLSTLCSQMFQKWVVLATLPEWLYGPDTLLDAGFSAAYCSLLVYFSLKDSKWLGGKTNGANTMGVLAFSQMPLVFLLVSKNNPITLLTGISYRRLNYLHRAAARACIVCAWVHAIAWTPPTWRKGELFDAYIQWGAIALFSFTMLWITSIRCVRRRAWEVFLAAHIVLSFMFLVAAILHWRKLAYWIWPAALLWSVDRAIRFHRMGSKHTKGKGGKVLVEVIDPKVLRVTLASTRSKWLPGQHAFLWLPTITRLPIEAHPFSFANVPTVESNSAVFLIKVHSDATRLLRDALNYHDGTAIPVLMEGPYGASPDLRDFDTIMLFAGGTGVAFSMSILLGLVLQGRGSSTGGRQLHLIWHVRSPRDVHWIAPLLAQISNAIDDGCQDKVRIGVYVTGSGGPEETVTLESRSIEDQITEHGAELPEAQITAMQTINFPSFMRWHRGRANLVRLVASGRRSAVGQVYISACGPPSLVRGVRFAVKEATSLRELMHGRPPIIYEEEPLAS